MGDFNSHQEVCQLDGLKVSSNDVRDLFTRNRGDSFIGTESGNPFFNHFLVLFGDCKALWDSFSSYDQEGQIHDDVKIQVIDNDEPGSCCTYIFRQETTNHESRLLVTSSGDDSEIIFQYVVGTPQGDESLAYQLTISGSDQSMYATIYVLEDNDEARYKRIQLRQIAINRVILSLENVVKVGEFPVRPDVDFNVHSFACEYSRYEGSGDVRVEVEKNTDRFFWNGFQSLFQDFLLIPEEYLFQGSSLDDVVLELVKELFL